MPIFKNPNEAAYLGRKKHFTDVIKNSGHANAIIWRQPEEDFNTNSTLVVMPGEQAIFIKGGVIDPVLEQYLAKARQNMKRGQKHYYECGRDELSFIFKTRTN